MASMATVAKIVILGSCGVGKTSLMVRYAKDTFHERFKPTIGVDFMVKRLTVNNVDITAQLWDTAGSERFRGLGTAYFRGADACVLVFDITNEETFLDLGDWKTAFTEQTENMTKSLFYVVGNKLDQEQDRNVSKRRATMWCSENGIESYHEVSAKDATHVEEVFTEIITHAVSLGNPYSSRGSTTPSIKLQSVHLEKDDDCC